MEKSPVTKVCIRLLTPTFKNHLPISCQAPPPVPLKSANCPRPPFFGNSFLYIGFSLTPSTPSSKAWIFQWTPKILKFFIVNLIIKVTKFLVKISQFEFFFCHWIFQILVYFLHKNCNPPPFRKKITRSFSPTPLWKLRSCHASTFWKFGRRSNHPCRKGKVHTMVTMIITW